MSLRAPTISQLVFPKVPLIQLLRIFTLNFVMGPRSIHLKSFLTSLFPLGQQVISTYNLFVGLNDPIKWLEVSMGGNLTNNYL